MVTWNDDSVEHRKEVWRAVRGYYIRFGVAYNFTGVPIKLARHGVLTFEDDRPMYCDGRSEAEHVCSELDTRRKILFVPAVEEPQLITA